MTEERDYQTEPDGIVRLGAMKSQRTTQTPEELRQMAEFEQLLAIRRAAIQLDEEDELMALMAADDEPEPDDESEPASDGQETPPRAAPQISAEHHAKLDALLAKLETKG